MPLSELMNSIIQKYGEPQEEIPPDSKRCNGLFFQFKYLLTFLQDAAVACRLYAGYCWPRNTASLFASHIWYMGTKTMVHFLVQKQVSLSSTHKTCRQPQTETKTITAIFLTGPKLISYF